MRQNITEEVISAHDGHELIKDLVDRIDRNFREKVVNVLGQRKADLDEFRKTADDTRKKSELKKILENKREKIRTALHLVQELRLNSGC